MTNGAAKARPADDALLLVDTAPIIHVLEGQSDDEALARRYRAILESWQPVPLDIDIAESAALRVRSLSMLPRSSRVRSLRVIQ